MSASASQLQGRDDIITAARSGALLPGTCADPAVVVCYGRLSSVWATEDPPEARPDPRPPGRVEVQGGFAAQRPGRCYLVVVDPGASNDLVTLRGVCQWCGGDGLHPFLSVRWRQVLGANIILTRTVALHSWIVKNVSGQPQIARPLTRHLWSCAGQALDPLAIYGLQFEDVACPRCAGHGGADWLGAGDWLGHSDTRARDAALG